ncbi:MAG TPA: ACP S-malonyltransferase [Burkholderiaceae bacterium]|nr:ACP S-malonyltransferase [Burkholderiaceae bacterium]
MKIAFVFPGQGSQSVGMLDSFESNAEVTQTLAQADAALGESLSGLIKQGPAEQLNLTTHTQPAMLTASVAIYRAWRAAGGPAPALVAGHSLGEFTALVAAGALQFEDAVRIVRARANAMQEAVPVGAGAMAAILGLSDDEVRAACTDAAGAGVVEAVNYNAPAQVVIAGAKAAVEKACEAAKARGAKRALPLPVSAPFHSSLMQPAAKVLEGVLAGVAVSAPAIPLINNVDVAIESDPAAIRVALVRQAAGPVRWVETVQAMQAQGVTHIVECGPGKVLQGLCKRIAPDVQALSISDATSLTQTLEALK